MTASTFDLGALRERPLRRLLAAQWASLVGDYIVIAALPFAVFSIGGSAGQVGLPALSGLIPQTVSSERLLGANALRGLALSSAAMIGPALAGILTAAGGVGWAFAADAASFLLSAAFLARVRVEQEAPSAAERSAIRELLEGWAEFRRRTWLWVIVVEFALLNALVFAPFQVLGASVANQSLGGAGAWATILTASGLGALAGGIVALSWRPGRPLLAGTLVIASWALPLLLLATAASVGLIVIVATAIVAALPSVRRLRPARLPTLPTPPYAFSGSGASR